MYQHQLAELQSQLSLAVAMRDSDLIQDIREEIKELKDSHADSSGAQFGTVAKNNIEHVAVQQTA